MITDGDIQQIYADVTGLCTESWRMEKARTVCLRNMDTRTAGHNVEVSSGHENL